MTLAVGCRQHPDDGSQSKSSTDLLVEAGELLVGLEGLRVYRVQRGLKVSNATVCTHPKSQAAATRANQAI